MKEYSPDQLRNIALVGHGGSGKTSLAEAMLFTGGTTTRLGRVEDGNTMSDYHPDEIERRISIDSSLLTIEWKGRKISALDSPGYLDRDVDRLYEVHDQVAVAVVPVGGCVQVDDVQSVDSLFDPVAGTTDRVVVESYCLVEPTVRQTYREPVENIDSGVEIHVVTLPNARET